MTPSFADRTSAHLNHDRPWVQARLVRPCPFFTMTPRRLGSVSPGSRLHRRGRSHFCSRPGTWVSEVRRVLEYGNRDRGGERHQNFTITQSQPLSYSLCTPFPRLHCGLQGGRLVHFLTNANLCHSTEVVSQAELGNAPGFSLSTSVVKVSFSATRVFAPDVLEMCFFFTPYLLGPDCVSSCDHSMLMMHHYILGGTSRMLGG